MPNMQGNNGSHLPEEEAFDPYRKWLGIPPEEQPPHHYRLLGLELFEEDADVIVNAADARLSFLQTFVKNQYAFMADRIAAQIKEAQACLLDPAKKAFYDGQLQRRLAALKKASVAASSLPNNAAAPSVNLQGNSAVPPALPLPPAPPSVAAEFAISEFQVPAYAKVSAYRKRKQWHLFTAAILVLAAVGCLLIFLLVKFKADDETERESAVARAASKGKKSSDTKSASSTSQSNSRAGKPAEKPAISLNGVQNSSSRKIVASAPMPTPVSDDHEALNAPNKEENPFENGPRKNTRVDAARKFNNPEPEKIPELDLSVAEESNRSIEGERGEERLSLQRAENNRKPIPDGIARQKAEKAAREIYGPGITASRTGAAKLLLSSQIWRQATNTKNDAAKQYVLMNLAYQLASDSARLQRAMALADSFAKFFEVDPWELKIQAVVKATKLAQGVQTTSANSPKIDGDEIVLQCLQIADEAKKAGQFDVAAKAVKAALPLAKKDPLLVHEMTATSKEIERLKTRFQPVRKALDTLKDKPDDLDANLVAGRWICFESHEWKKGLPRLAKSSNADLAKVAAQDLAAPQAAKEQLALADAWWVLAQKEEGNIKNSLLARAEYWYDCALPKLDESKKRAAETRLRIIAGFDAKDASGSDVIPSGNVAFRNNGPSAAAFGINADKFINFYKLFDGDSRNPAWNGDAANSPMPCAWIITLDRIYKLQQVRFHFYDGDGSYYHYGIDVSADGKKYTTLIDRTVGLTYKWQVVPVHGMPVKYVRLRGFYSNKNRLFSVTEFEAYCIPPKP